jgi:hypothetical protein
MNFVDNWLEELREWVSTRKCDFFLMVLLIDIIPLPPSLSPCPT